MLTLPQSCFLMLSGGFMESFLFNGQLLYLTLCLDGYLNATCALCGFSIGLLVSVGIFAISSLLIGLLCFLRALTGCLWVCGSIFGCCWVLKVFLGLLLELGPWCFGGTSVKGWGQNWLCALIMKWRAKPWLSETPDILYFHRRRWDTFVQLQFLFGNYFTLLFNLNWK